MSNQKASTPFLLGKWMVDPDALQLRNGDETVVIRAKAMAVLLELVSHAGEVVKKDAILNAVWSRGFVVEGVLKRSISDLRRALGDSASAPKYIETIPKRGYRLIAELSAPAFPAEQASDLSVEPYMGLKTFGFDDANLFFGRDAVCKEISEKLRQSNTATAFTLILGMSGVGKSSLVQAGVLPKLIRSDLDKRAIFRHSDIPGDLFDGLASAFLKESALPSLYDANFGQNELAASLRNQPNTTVTRIGRHLRRDQSDARLYVVVDQMEELFAFTRVEAPERTAFFSLMKVMARSGFIQLIATMRSDYYHRFCDNPDLLELKTLGSQYDLMPPTAADIRSIIRKPAQRAGIGFEKTTDESSSSLDEVIADSAIKYPEALPLLQFVLYELYKRRDERGFMTFDAYYQLGGVEGCLSQRAEETYKSQSPETKKALPHVLDALVTSVHENSVAFSLHPALRDKLVIDSHSERLVDALTEARLLTTHLTHDGESRIVRAAHEALFLHWDRARNWLEANISLVRTHRFLEDAATRWEREGKRSDLLLAKGWQLSRAEALLNSSIALNPIESNYLQLSQRQAHKKNRIVKGLAASVSVLVVVAFSALYAARENNLLANIERERAQSVSMVANQTISLLSNMFELSDPGAKRAHNFTPKEILDEGAERIIAEFGEHPIVQATLLQTIGVIYNKRGNYEDAQKVLRITIGELTKSFGNEHPLVPDVITDLAKNYHDMGEFEKALDHVEQALNLRLALFGHKHRKVAQSMHLKGWIQYSLGHSNQAEELVRNGLELQLELQEMGIADLDLDLATSQKSLGVFLFQRGALQEAETHLKTALAIRRAMLGNDHPDVGMSLNHMATLYTNMRDFPRAKVFSEEALQLNLSLLGADHPDVALSYYNLAGVHSRLGEYDVAAGYAQTCIDINIKALGNDHGIVAIAKGFLGSVRVAQQMPQEALELVSEAMQILQPTLPESHWRIAWLHAIRGAALADLGDHEQAERILLSAYASISRSKGAADDASQRVRGFLEQLYDPSTHANDFQRVQDKILSANLAASNNL